MSKEKIGLALAGGGLRGSYQIGAYKAMKEHNIKVNVVTGTSIGSFNGAMIASGKDKELLEFWETIDVANFFEVDESFKDSVLTLKKMKLLFETAKNKINNKGFNIAPLRNRLNELLDEEKLRNSKVDYGCCTVRGKDSKPLLVFVKDMAKGKVADYILASCFLPIFKKEKLIDDNYYMDGGFYDALSAAMLETVGCTKIYAIHLNGFGHERPIKNKGIEIINIRPRISLGSQLTLDNKIISRNIKLGYYDALKVLDNLDGKNYYFKGKPLSYYNRLVKNLDSKYLDKTIIRLLAKNSKEAIIKAIERILKKEEMEIFEVYKINSIIKFINKNFKGQDFEYEFIKKIGKEMLL